MTGIPRNMQIVNSFSHIVYQTVLLLYVSCHHFIPNLIFFLSKENLIGLIQMCNIQKQGSVKTY